MQTSMMILLRNGTTTSFVVDWPGGDGEVAIDGTFGGATFTLQKQNMLTNNWADMDTTELSFTAAGVAGFRAAPGPIRFSSSGGAPTAMYAYLSLLPVGQL